MQDAMSMVAWRMVHGMLMYGWTRSLLSLPRLNTGFLIDANHPDSFSEQSSRVFVQVQDWLCPLEKLLRVLNVLPCMVTPGVDLLGSEPTANGSG